MYKLYRLCRVNPPAFHPNLEKVIARNTSSSRPQSVQAQSPGSVACQGHIAGACFKRYMKQLDQNEELEICNCSLCSLTNKMVMKDLAASVVVK